MSRKATSTTRPVVAGVRRRRPSWLNAYGWNQRAVPRVEPVGDHVLRLAAADPGDTRDPGWSAVGRRASTGRGSGSSPPAASSRTQASTPSSWAGNGSQPGTPRRPEREAVPAAHQCPRSSPQPGTAARRGAGTRPGRRAARRRRRARPPPRRPRWSARTARSPRISRLAASTIPVARGPGLRSFQRRLDQPGRASRQVGCCSAQVHAGNRRTGTRSLTIVAQPFRSRPSPP